MSERHITAAEALVFCATDAYADGSRACRVCYAVFLPCRDTDRHAPGCPVGRAERAVGRRQGVQAPEKRAGAWPRLKS